MQLYGSFFDFLQLVFFLREEYCSPGLPDCCTITKLIIFNNSAWWSIMLAAIFGWYDSAFGALVLLSIFWNLLIFISFPMFRGFNSLGSCYCSCSSGGTYNRRYGVVWRETSGDDHMVFNAQFFCSSVFSRGKKMYAKVVCDVEVLARTFWQYLVLATRHARFFALTSAAAGYWLLFEVECQNISSFKRFFSL